MANKSILAYKGFNSDLSCLGFQYEVGKKYTIPEEEIKMCEKGFHACSDPRDLARFYHNSESRYYKVLLSGKIEKIKIDSYGNRYKICASEIEFIEEIDLIKECIKVDKSVSKLFKNQETKLSNRLLGSISKNNDWSKIKKNDISIGSRIIIEDGTYNTIWTCIEKEDDKYYFLAEPIGLYPIDCSKSIHHFTDTWVYNSILVPLSDNISSILGSHLQSMSYDDNDKQVESLITLPTSENVCRDYIGDNFNFFKILNYRKLFYEYIRTTFWLRSVVSSSYFASASYDGGANYDYASYHVFLRPLICIR